MPRLAPVCLRLSEQDGSGRQAACHQRCMEDGRSHSPGGISRLLSGRNSQFCMRRAVWGAGDWPTDRAVRVDDLARASTKCGNAQRWPGVSSDHRAVACRECCPAPEACEAGGQCGIAGLCAGAVGWRDRGARRGGGPWATDILVGPLTRASAATTMGDGMEPAADCPSPAARFSGR